MERIIRFYRMIDEYELPFPNEFRFEELQDTIVGLPDDAGLCNATG